ncbi:MAG TPA: hypothetical protein PKW80_11045 [Bacteroidales bacterium]|nr:hypothetical protein [Bacteroidales bacterium]
MKIKSQKENSGRYEYHRYDINIISTLKKMEKMIETNSQNLKTNIADACEFINHMWFMAETYYNSLPANSVEKNESFEEHKLSNLLIIPSDHPSFQTGLALELNTREIYELRAFLNYHQKNFKGFGDVLPEHFLGLLEYLIVPHLNAWSPFKKGMIEACIMDWLEAKKSTRRNTVKSIKVSNTLNSLTDIIDKKNISDIQFKENVLNELSRIKTLVDFPGINIKKSTKRNKTETTVKNHIDYSALFKSDALFTKAMLLLAEKKLIDGISYKWLGNKKTKSFLAMIIKTFQSRGYYKEGVSLKNPLIKEIVKDFFMFDVKMDTIKHTKIDSSSVKFIPFCTDNK